MARTIKRQPFTVSTSSNSYAKPQVLIQAEFKGINDTKNDVLADSMSFASAENVYVDDNMLLVSRPPFKFYDMEGFIVKEWRFGPYKLRLYRTLTHNNEVIESPGAFEESELTFTYLLKCVSHQPYAPREDTYENMTWQLPVSEVGWTYTPDVTCAEIEDKIFIWFAGFDLVVFNTAEVYFESGIKYLYLPIRSLVINGIETPFEAENFLTPTGRRRYQYSALSSVNFEALIGKEVRVGLSGPMTEGSSKYLYTTTVQDEQEQVLVYPYTAIGNNYHVEIAHGLMTTVFMRYSEASGTIEISSDGRYFESLPALDDILGLPQLTKDATHVVAFTSKGVAWCKLFADESDENALTFLRVWVTYDYAYRHTDDDTYKSIDRSFIPAGHFENTDQFAYVFRPEDSTNALLYAEWPNGTQGQAWGIRTMTETYDETTRLIINDDIKVATGYLAPVGENPNGLIVAILCTQDTDKTMRTIHCMFYGDEVNLLWSQSREDILQISCRQSDIKVSPTSINEYLVQIATSAHTGDLFDYSYIKYNLTGGPSAVNSRTMRFEHRRSKQLRIGENGVVTDSYYLRGDWRTYHVIELPTLRLDEVDEVVANNDILQIAGFDGNIHLVSETDVNTWELSAGQITSGAIVAWTSNARTGAEYLLPREIDYDNTWATKGPLFYIERIAPVDGEWQVLDGLIHTGDLVRLRAYDDEVYFGKFSPGNPVDDTLEVVPWEYDEVPTWTEYPKPLIAVGDGYREWNDGDALPTGTVTFYGTARIIPQILPITANEQGIWLSVNGTLWTSQQSTENILELDEYINTGRHDTPDGSRTQAIKANLWVPTHHKTLNEHYFSFEVDGRHILQVTQTKRDEDNLLGDNAADFLLYLPKRNEQIFATKITNIHPIANNIIAVFTEQSIWNITVSTLEDGTTVYSAPILSKIPAGCRDGDDVMTALDGQALLLATPRGIAALAPQDFVATADNVMTYLSDAIQETYYNLYKDKVESTVVEEGYDPHIKMTFYRYWLLFYRYMDRDILVFDTRTSAWWKWVAPYPIRQITSDIHLHLIMQVDYSLTHSLGGVSYVWKDHEDTEYIGPHDSVISLPAGIESRVGYYDDIVEGALNGLSRIVYENPFIGYRKIIQYASPIITWSFVSQKLHFGQINNYKTVKGLTAALKGDDALQAVVSTKVYRNMYHPEQSDVVEMPVNETRTFVYRLNLMHVIYFQYEFRNDAALEEQVPLKLGSLTIKYEVKEGIR